MNKKYLPTWDSLKKHPTPAWFRDAKFGIYTHWGVYCVPARGPNSTWYPYYMYQEGTDQYKYHLRTYGGTANFGYKDFIPMFTGEKFDPDEWAELFKLSGAQYAGPVGEHHDGFSMWDTKYSKWNSARMGPKRDVVGLNEKDVPEFTGRDVRFTVKGNALYPTVLGWPGEVATIETVKCLYPAEIRSARMLGADQELEWSLTSEGMRIKTPGKKPCEHAYVFKIVRGRPYP